MQALTAPLKELADYDKMLEDVNLIVAKICFANEFIRG